MIEFDYNIINSSKSYRSWVKLFRKLFRFFFTIETEGEENIPDGGYILCSNHFTHIDFLLLSYSQKLPDIYCMAMSELYRKPIQGRFMLAMNCFPVERGRGRAEPAVRYAVKLLKSGRCMAIFPEGALSREYPFAHQ